MPEDLYFLMIKNSFENTEETIFKNKVPYLMKNKNNV